VPRELPNPAQFQLKHLFGLCTAAAILFGILAPGFRRLGRGDQILVGIQLVVLTISICGILLWLLRARLKAQKTAGPLIERFDRMSSQIFSWIIAAALWLMYGATVWVQSQDPDQSAAIFPGNPWFLWFAVNYVIVRKWWQIDPSGLEACQNGIIWSGFHCVAWEEISRYSWSGNPPAQVNLFLKQRFVLNLKTDRTFYDRLNSILAEHVKP
jgi:hypothetical protein